MQPAAYLLTRSLIAWLQLLEKDAHAFSNSPQIVIAAGAGHCWAVSYALFVAVLVRAVRHERHVHGYFPHNKEPIDLLPGWVLFAERVSAMAMVAWWLVGSILFLLRLVEEDNQFLPATKRDVGLPALVEWARNPLVRAGLKFLQTLCAAALFLSSGVLAVALVVMQGSITGSEVALVFVSLGFAAPFAGMTLLRFHSVRRVEGAVALSAMACEAASYGPQLVVLLSLADMSGAAHHWQGGAHAAAALGFAMSILACALAPPSSVGVGLPPKGWEMATSAMGNFVGLVALLLCFPLQGWSLALGVLVSVAFLIAAASFCISSVRIGVLELIGPVMPLRSNEKGRKPSQRREAIRVVARILAVASAAAAMVNIVEQRRRLTAHSNVQYESYESYAKDSPAFPDREDYNWDYDEDGSPWHHDVMPLLLRWKEGVQMPPDTDVLNELIQALAAEEDHVYVQDTLEKHRVMLFGLAVGKDESETLAAKWPSVREQGKIAEWADLDFPARLSRDECDTLLDIFGDKLSDGENESAGAAAASNGTSSDSKVGEPDALAEVKKAVCQAHFRWLGHYDMDEDYMGDLYGDYDTEGRYRGDEDMVDDGDGGAEEDGEGTDAGDAEMNPDGDEPPPDDM
mmetsp:Transcript_12174/g.22425  ORF Transcript_12174/g.22425 Transcript_12174/m.22425 type:complete len:629 (-) Transcript_12174:53-1939(-)